MSRSPLDALLRDQNLVLVFLPNTNELQRFVWSQAFAGLEREYRLHYVLPSVEAEKILATAGGAITPATSTVIEVPPERFKKWQEIFQAACIHYAPVSPSFALRAGLAPDPDWRRFRDVDREDRAPLDAAFDTQVEALLDGLSPLPAILELLDRLNPLFCVAPTSLLDIFCNDVVWACNTANVPSLLLQSGWDNMSSKGLLAMRPSFLGCWGPQSREHAKVIQRLSPKSLDTLGAPHYEMLKPATATEVQQIRAELGLAERERLILFGGSFRQFDETRTLQLIERAIGRDRLPGVTVVYRPHPWRAARQHEDSFFSRTWQHVVFDPSMRDRYVREQEEAGFIKRNVPMFDMVYLSRLLSAADAVISPMSTLLLESLLLGRPTMAIAFSDGKHRYDPSVTAQMTHFADLRESSALIWCDDQERLVKECARLLREEPGSHASARRNLLRTVVTTEPGTYADRLAEFCRNKVELRGRKQRGERAAARRDTISHAYGAHLIAQAYCGLDDSRLTVPDYWMHGWIPSYHNLHPALIALHKKEGQHDAYDYQGQIREEKAHTMQWVSREDQAEFLRRHGYQHVKAIGLPITYLSDSGVEREPGSLLVLPPHSHKNHGGDDPLAERYAEMIAELRPRFSRIAVGVHEDDRAKGQWVDSFRRRGIDVFVTTDQSDPNTLVRLQRLLSSFEYVTTNGYGSHIALAAYCGAKVSVYGPFAEFPLERMKVTHAVKMFPELLEQAYQLCTEQALRRHYPFLFVDPDRAVVRRDWAAREVGEPSRVTPAELRRLFGWEAAAAAPRIAARQERPAPLVLFATAHAGFVRNFEDVIAGLLDAGVNVHVQLSKAHHTISMSDYPLASVEGGGRLTHATNDLGASGEPRPGVDRIRVLRDLILYSRPQYDDAVDLRGRFTDLQKKSALPVSVQAALATVLPRTPVGFRNLLDRVLRLRDEAAPPAATAEQLIGTLRPDYVIATPVVNFRSREADILKAAKRQRIPTLLPVASWDNLTNKGRLHVQPDRIAVWNEAMAREAVELHGVRREAVWVTGATVFDSWFGRSPSRDRDTFCRELGLEPQLPIVVYLCSSVSIAGQFEGSLVKAWLLAVRGASSPAAKANVVVRPHPMAREPWANVAVVEEDGVARWRRAVVWPLAPRHPTDPETRAEFFDTIFHADVVVGLNTSAMIEAVILGRPVLTFVGHEQALSQTGNLHFRYLAESGCVSTASSLEEHVRQLAERLGQPIDGAARARFIESFVRPLGRDVSASAALVARILTELGVAPRARSTSTAAEPAPLTSGALA